MRSSLLFLEYIGSGGLVLSAVFCVNYVTWTKGSWIFSVIWQCFAVVAAWQTAALVRKVLQCVFQVAEINAHMCCSFSHGARAESLSSEYWNTL